MAIILDLGHRQRSHFPLLLMTRQTMTAIRLDGKRIAGEIREDVAKDVADFVASGGPKPCLTAVLVGEDPASQVYVRNKSRACEKAGIDGRTMRLPAETTQAELMAVVQGLNDDPQVHGILVQLPLPSASSGGNGGEGFDERQILDAVDPLKDVDAFSPVNVGLVDAGASSILALHASWHRSVAAPLRHRCGGQACRRRRTQRHCRQADGNDVGPA